jgi:CheY-like chemotaxis protein
METVEVLHRYFDHTGLAEVWREGSIAADSQEVASHLDSGTRLTFDSSARVGPHGEPGPSVILVDDDVAATEMYRIGLEHDGFAVTAARDAVGLFEAMSIRLPDILVLDWQLPGMNGDEILQRIRLDDRTRALPVVMLSNYPPQKDGQIDRVFMAGALAWLEKVNTSPTLLAEKLREALAS